MNDQPVRVRFAPSPTGYLHIGGARSALFNWLFARRYNGTFILRIEDTDRARYVPDSLDDIMGGLRWLGLEWDEGPEVGGKYGPYFQSERTELYRHWADWLVQEGHAYRCYCSPERLRAMREEQQRRKQPPGYDHHCRFLSQQERAQHEAAGDPYVIRFAAPLEGQTTFTDLIRGQITFEHRQVDDFVLLKSDGYPTYHHANVIDDHFMHISHIIRADEWIPSVPKHILLYRAYGWEPPLMAHLPVILDPSGKGKMSKRKAEASGYKIFIHELRESGYLPEAVFNFLATIGWSLDGRTEVFDRETAIQHFSIEAVNPAPAALPYQKLDWLNGVYIRNLDVDELHKRLIPFLSRDLGLDEETLRTSRELQVLVPHIQERIKTLSDAAALVDFAFTNRMEYDPKLLIGRKMTAAESLAALQAARRVLAELPEFSEESQEQALRGLAKELGLKAGQLFGILRVAATGKTVTPPLFGTFAALGRERLLRRLDEAEAKLAALVDEQMM